MKIELTCEQIEIIVREELKDELRWYYNLGEVGTKRYKAFKRTLKYYMSDTAFREFIKGVEYD